MVTVVTAEHLHLVEPQNVVARVCRQALVERAVEAGDDVVDHDLAVAGRVGGRTFVADPRRARSQRCGPAVDGHGSSRHNQFRRPPTPTRPLQTSSVAIAITCATPISCAYPARSSGAKHSASGRALPRQFDPIDHSRTVQAGYRRLHPALICTGVLLWSAVRSLRASRARSNRAPIVGKLVWKLLEGERTYRNEVRDYTSAYEVRRSVRTWRAWSTPSVTKSPTGKRTRTRSSASARVRAQCPPEQFRYGSRTCPTAIDQGGDAVGLRPIA